MLDLLLYSIIAIALLAVGTYSIWPKINFKHLQINTTALILSLPFERIPSFEIAGATLRPSQILVITAFYILTILFFKKDSQLAKITFHPIYKWFLLFFVLSIPSWFFIADIKKFLISFVATALVFTAAFIISNITQDIWTKFKYLLWTMFGVMVFSMYQFAGDMIGLPMSVTGIKGLFASHVFAIPRIHATFNEPSYYANALMIPMFGFAYMAMSQIKIKLPKLGELTKRQSVFVTSSISVLAFILLILTIAKSLYIFLPIVFLYFLWTLQFYNQKRLALVIVSKIILSILTAFTVSVMLFEKVRFIVVDKLWKHLSETLEGNSATISERSAFFSAAQELISWQSMLGAGAGQFGVNASLLLKYLTENTRDIIVFNVYAEVWLEWGFVPFAIFVGVLLYTFFKSIKNIKISYKRKDQKSVIMLSTLSVYLLGSILQWNFISPIYIMPIFIAIGLLLAIDTSIKKEIKQ